MQILPFPLKFLSYLYINGIMEYWFQIAFLLIEISLPKSRSTVLIYLCNLQVMPAIYKDNKKLSAINTKFLIKARNFKEPDVHKYINISIRILDP
jgi:uncharacterized membrane protein